MNVSNLDNIKQNKSNRLGGGEKENLNKKKRLHIS